MPQIFRPRANSIARIVLVSIVAVPLGALAMGQYVYRTSWYTRVGRYVEQPVPFSHQHHVGGLGLDCRYCHTGVETSPVAGIPPTETCMTCHSQLYTNADMLAPVRQSMASGKPPRWQRVHDLPQYVYFDHAVHVRNGIGCTTCHGQIDRMPLTAKAHSLHMQWCLDCHRNPERYLRPPDKIFSTDWKPPPEQAEKGRQLAEFYGSVCHR
jgi:hypothetical protein